MREHVLGIVNQLDRDSIDNMIKQHQDIINKQGNSKKKDASTTLPSSNRPVYEVLHNDRIMPVKPRDRFIAKRLVQDEKYKEQLAENYIARYQDVSRETADYYKSKAISLYMTEQFCKGDKYIKSKHKALISESYEAIKPRKQRSKLSFK